MTQFLLLLYKPIPSVFGVGSGSSPSRSQAPELCFCFSNKTAECCLTRLTSVLKRLHETSTTLLSTCMKMSQV